MHFLLILLYILLVSWNCPTLFSTIIISLLSLREIQQDIMNLCLFPRLSKTCFKWEALCLKRIAHLSWNSYYVCWRLHSSFNIMMLLEDILYGISIFSTKNVWLFNQFPPFPCNILYAPSLEDLLRTLLLSMQHPIRDIHM